MSAVKIGEAWPVVGQPFTTDELDRMPDDGRRYEVLDGALVVGPRPGAIHQAVAARLAALLLRACPQDMFVISGAAVRLTHTTEFAPDVTVVRQIPPGGGKLTEPPLLAVEVRTPATALIDLHRRKAAYQAFGVRSYWVIVPDIRRPELTVFEAVDGRYEQAAQVRAGEAFSAWQPFAVEVVPARLVAGLGPVTPAGDGISATA